MATVPNAKQATFTDGSGPSGDILNINTVDGQIEIPNAKSVKFYSDAYTTLRGQISGGNFAPAQSSSAAAVTNGATIATANIGVARVAPAAARTGLILQAGTLPGQQCWVVNEAANAFSIIFDVSGTSHVADGVNNIIYGGQARLFVWDSNVSLWFTNPVLNNGTVDLVQSATAVATGAAGTIATAGVGVSRVSPAGAVTGIIMEAGTIPGQICLVVNEAVYANSVQMDVSGTSHVADGGNCFIPGLSARLFIWDTGTSLWYEHNIEKLYIDASQAFTVNDGTNDVFNINSHDKRAELANAMILRMYSDAYTTRTVELSGGTISVLQSATAPDIADAGTITTAGVGVARLTPGAAKTGIIMQVGTLAGQEVWVVNEAAGANSLTMAVAGTSNVADGTSTVIAGLTAAKFVWTGALWYRAA